MRELCRVGGIGGVQVGDKIFRGSQSFFDFISISNSSHIVFLGDHHLGIFYIRDISLFACHCIALLDAQFSNLPTPQSLVSEMAEFSKPDYK